LFVVAFKNKAWYQLDVMIACVDVHYRGAIAVAACVLFRDWTDAEPKQVIVECMEHPAQYEPGRFYKRELPCLLKVLERAKEPLAAVIVDGYVWLSGQQKPGLGAYLHKALGGAVPVIGVAKSRFSGAGSAETIFRGSSRRPR
jgi:deoxyribonuclease V